MILARYAVNMDDPSYSHPSNDRCDAAMLEILRGRSARAKLLSLDAFWGSAVVLVRAGVVSQHPEWSEALVTAETARRMAGQWEQREGE